MGKNKIKPEDIKQIENMIDLDAIVGGHSTNLGEYIEQLYYLLSTHVSCTKCGSAVSSKWASTYIIKFSCTNSNCGYEEEVDISSV